QPCGVLLSRTDPLQIPSSRETAAAFGREVAFAFGRVAPEDVEVECWSRRRRTLPARSRQHAMDIRRNRRHIVWWQIDRGHAGARATAAQNREESFTRFIVQHDVRSEQV